MGHNGAAMGWWMVFAGTLWLVLWGTVIYLAVRATRRWTEARVTGRDDL